MNMQRINFLKNENNIIFNCLFKQLLCYLSFLMNNKILNIIDPSVWVENVGFGRRTHHFFKKKFDKIERKMIVISCFLRFFS